MDRPRLALGGRADGAVDPARAEHHVAARLRGRHRIEGSHASVGGMRMAKILGNFHMALLIGVVLLVAAMVGLHRDVMDGVYWTQFLRYLHVFAGILWIG